MPCYYPLRGWLGKTINPETGKRSIVFNPSEGFVDYPREVACGQCIGCRSDRSRTWAMRCVHEASMHADNCFLTLTYDDDHIPSGGTLDKSHFPNFMKRLRERFFGSSKSNIRYFHCGEYGENFSRPHYHACLFNFDFPDKVLAYSNSKGDRFYNSSICSELWTFGFHTISGLTYDVAAYVARYVSKKVTGEKAADHYQGREPEYVTMSRRPAIGATWLNAYSSDVYPADKVVIRDGLNLKPPKYYDKILELTNDEMFASIKEARIARAKADVNNSPERLAERWLAARLRAKAQKSARSFERG